MIDQEWLRLLPAVVGGREFHRGMQEGRQHWWNDWRGEATVPEIAAFLGEDWSVRLVRQRNQEAQVLGLPVLSDGYIVGFVLGWIGAVQGD